MSTAFQINALVPDIWTEHPPSNNYYCKAATKMMESITNHS